MGCDLRKEICIFVKLEKQEVVLGIVSKIKNNTILTNIASLGLLQMANYVIPILVIPFVTRALGADAFGKAMYAQNIIAYLTIIVNYGFEYAATQDVAINKENHQRLVDIFWSVISSKFVLLLVSFMILCGLYFVFPRVHEDIQLYLFAALVNIGFAIFPTWFFQGMEKMAKMAIFNFSVRVISGTLTVLLITAPSHYRFYLLISSLAYVVVGFVAFIYVIKHYSLLPKNFKFDFSPIKKGFPIFLNLAFATLYTTAGFTILGFYFSDMDLGFYSGAYKIIMAFVMLTSMPISMSLFPMISRKFNESRAEGLATLKKCSYIVGGVGILVSIFVFLAAPILVRLLLGPEFGLSVNMLRAFAPLPFLIIMASMFTVQGLYGMQMQKYAPFVGLTVGVSCVGFTLLLIPSLGIYSAIVGYVSAELVEVLISAGIIIFKKNNCL